MPNPFSILRLLRNRELLLSLSVVLGLLAGRPAQWTEPLILPVLGLVMTFATLLISGTDLRPARSLLLPGLAGIGINYGLLSGAILAVAFLLVRDPDLRTGFVILASVPPGVAVIPFTDFLGGNRSYALLGSLACYLAGLALMPLIAFVFLGSGLLQPLTLLSVAAQLILAPLVLSRLLIRFGLRPALSRIKGAVTNWGFFVVTYTIVGLNRDLILQDPVGLLPVAGVALITIWALGPLIRWTALRLGAGSGTAAALMFLGTIKNYGIAGGVSLALLGTEAALPATVSVVFMIGFMVLQGILQHGRRPAERS
jgi:BASS family bile acid:Na+ symporter